MFQYKDDSTIYLKTDHGIDIAVTFDGSSVDYIYMDGEEYGVNDDNLDGIFVVCRGAYYSLKKLSVEAEDDYAQIMAEVWAERAAEGRHERSMMASDRYI